MKSKKPKFLRKLMPVKKFPSEPKVMKELHKIRERMSKMSKEEFHKSLEKASKEFNETINT